MTIQFFINIDYAFRLSSDLKGNLMPNGIEVLVSKYTKNIDIYLVSLRHRWNGKLQFQV